MTDIKIQHSRVSSTTERGVSGVSAHLARTPVEDRGPTIAVAQPRVGA